MRLLFDEDHAPRLVSALADLFPGSLHVSGVGLAEGDDAAVWSHAKGQGLAIVSKDADFQQRSFVEGHPPKVIWIRLGNCSTDAIERVVRAREKEILAFGADEEASFLVLS